MNFEVMVQKAINTKAKADLRFSHMIQDLDIRCPKSNCLLNSTTLKVHTQGTTAKNFHPKELKVKEAKPTLFQAKASELFKQVCKKKKKKRHQKKRDKE